MNKDYEVTTEVTSTTADYRAVAPDAKRQVEYKMPLCLAYFAWIFAFSMPCWKLLMAF